MPLYVDHLSCPRAPKYDDGLNVNACQIPINVVS